VIPTTIPNESLSGRRVEISNIRSMLYCKRGTISYVMSSGDANIQVLLDGEAYTTFWGREDLSFITEIERKTNDGCECGSSAVGSPRHSYYCKLYKDWEDVK
jgi:hypothetical protein